MRTVVVIATAALLGSSVVSGCGGANAGYCDAIKADAPILTDFTATDVKPDFTNIPRFLVDAKQLGRQAPDDVKGDWNIVVKTLEGLTEALKAAGLTFPQFETFLETGQLPPNVTQAKTAGLALQYQQLGTDSMTRAANEITNQAADVCKVDLTKKG